MTNGSAWNAVSAFANCGRAVAHVRGSYVPIAAVSTRTLRPAIEDYFDPARCDEKPLFRQRMHMYQRITTPASSLTENDVEAGYVRIIGAGEDERLPTPISTHASIRWKGLLLGNKIDFVRPFLPL